MKKHNFDSELDDYLKYWKVIRRWALFNYEVNQAELELLLFLKSERYFSQSRFLEYNYLFSWDTQRFANMKKKNLITFYRRKRDGYRYNVYQLTPKAKRILKGVYAHLNGETFKEHARKANESYTERNYRNYIKRLNKRVKEQERRRSPVLRTPNDPQA